MFKIALNLFRRKSYPLPLIIKRIIYLCRQPCRPTIHRRPNRRYTILFYRYSFQIRSRISDRMPHKYGIAFHLTTSVMHQQRSMAHTFINHFRESDLEMTFVNIRGFSDQFRFGFLDSDPVAVLRFIVFYTDIRSERTSSIETDLSVGCIVNIVFLCFLHIYSVTVYFRNFRHRRLIRLHLHRIHRIPFRNGDAIRNIRLPGSLYDTYQIPVVAFHRKGVTVFIHKRDLPCDLCAAECSFDLQCGRGMLRVAVRIGVQGVPGVLQAGGFSVVGCCDGDFLRLLRRVFGGCFGGRLAV